VRRTRLIDELGQRLRERASTPPRARLDPGRGGFVAMAVVAVLVAAGVGCWVLAARPHRLPAAMSSQSSRPAPASAAAGGSLASPLSAVSAGSSSSTVLVIDVVGKVRHPGVYRLPPGSRVDDAVTAAGGVLAGVDPVTVNLARKLADGEQLVIGVTGPAATAGPPAGEGGSATGTGSGTGSSLIDLNSATVTQLDALPGVGPVLAQRIVDWRTQHGKFDTVDQLQSVSGIGDAKYGDLKPLVTVG
jgi:competence protein ComEA